MNAVAPEPGTLAAVKEAVKNFEAVQSKYRSYGAYDTEPDSIFQHVLWKTINDKDAAIPQTGDGWELYSHTMDCTEAASALHLACLGVIQAIFACRMAESKKVREYITSVCWRYA